MGLALKGQALLLSSILPQLSAPGLLLDQFSFASGASGPKMKGPFGRRHAMDTYNIDLQIWEQEK